jgi:arginase
MDTSLIYVPYDTGYFDVRMGHGPTHFREQGIRKRLEERGHSVVETTIEASAAWRAEVRTAFELFDRISREVDAAVVAGRFPLVISGNCNGSVGAVSGIREEPLAIVWFDGHGDFNTPEITTNGSLDHMGLAIATGRCWRTLASCVAGFRPVNPRHVILVGARDFDTSEISHLQEAGVSHVTVPAVREHGIAPSLAPLLQHLKDEVSGVYIHVDLDVHDPRDMPSNEFAPPDGLSRAEVREAVSTVSQHLPVRGGGIASYDPALDHSGRAFEAGAELVNLVVQARA